MTFSDPFEEIKKIIERNEEKIKEEKKIVNYGENEEMDGVIQRNFASFNLYSFFQYKNTTSNIILKQKLLFTEIIGQSLIYPEIKSKISTEKYDIELHPSKKKIIIFKTSYNKGFDKQLAHKSSFGLILNCSHQEIIQLLLKKGKISSYNSGKLRSFSMNIHDWNCYLYQNQSDAQTNFQINIIIMKNLECVTHEINKDFQIFINLKPQEERLLAFRTKDPMDGWNYQQEIIYTVQ